MGWCWHVVYTPRGCRWYDIRGHLEPSVYMHGGHAKHTPKSSHAPHLENRWCAVIAGGSSRSRGAPSTVLGSANSRLRNALRALCRKEV